MIQFSELFFSPCIFRQVVYRFSKSQDLGINNKNNND